MQLEAHEHHQGLVATITESYADALYPEPNVISWLRMITVDGNSAGFLMCSEPFDRSGNPWLWRLLSDKKFQNKGLGRCVLNEVIRRNRDKEFQKLFVSWFPDGPNPGDFYRKMGFAETDQHNVGEIEAV